MTGLLKKALFDWPIRLKGNSKCTKGNSLSLLRAQIKDLSPASHKSVAGVMLCLQHRLPY